MNPLTKASLLLLALLASFTCLPAKQVPTAEQQQQLHYSKRGLGEGKQMVYMDEDEQDDAKTINVQPGLIKPSSDSKFFIRPVGYSGGKKKYIKVKNMRCYMEDDLPDSKAFSKKQQSDKSSYLEKKKGFSIGSGFDISTDLHSIDGKVSADVGVMLPHAIAAKLANDALGQVLDGTKQVMSTFLPWQGGDDYKTSSSSRSNLGSDVNGVYKNIFDIIGMFTKTASNISLINDDKFKAFIKFIQEILEKLTMLPKF